MKNLGKKVILNELRIENEMLKLINEKIEEKEEKGQVLNETHRIIKWKFETIGAIHMLEYLLTKFEENERE